MKKLTIIIMILGVFTAKANLVIKDGYLRFVNPSGVLLYVTNSSDLVKANEVQILSTNLVNKDGYLRFVSPSGVLLYVTNSSDLVKVNEVQVPSK